MAQGPDLFAHADSRPAPRLWCDRMADERFAELLNVDDRWRAHGLGVWIDELYANVLRGTSGEKDSVCGQ